MNFSPQQIRQQVLTMAFSGQSVHVPSAFSIVEILCCLYPQYVDPRNEESDIFVLSKGHGTMSLYAILAEMGVIKKEELKNYFKDGSLLHGLPEIHTPGIEVSSGSLGHGLAIAAGRALGFKLKNKSQRVFCLVGDGEMNEGPNWESMLFANQQQLNNLVVIVDVNQWQAMGTTKDVLDLENLTAKFEAFGFLTERCDGHDIKAVNQSLEKLVNASGNAPRALIADTLKGKGVSFIEGDNSWHYRKLDQQTYEAAMKEVQDA